MVRSSDENMSKELDFNNAPTHEYNMQDFVKMMNLRNHITEGQEDVTYRDFIDQVAMKVRELEDEYAKLTEKLLAKQEDIWEPVIKIGIGMNPKNVLYDLGASVSTIPNLLYNRLNLAPYIASELRLHLADSTFKQAVGINENIVVQIRDCPILLDLVIVDIPEDENA